MVTGQLTRLVAGLLFPNFKCFVFIYGGVLHAGSYLEGGDGDGDGDGDVQVDVNPRVENERS